MPEKPNIINIESILGGQSELRYFGSKGQFQGSYAIDPDQPAADTGTQSLGASGYLRPVPSKEIDNAATLAGAPMWMVTNPKDDKVYVYDATGSAYTLDPATYTLTALSDGGSLSSSSGNGCAYHKNYIYFFKNTDVARYGPLNGTAAFNGTYWTAGAVSTTATVNTTYPSLVQATKALPNHPAHLHPHDGRLYFGDVSGNQGMIHYIDTTKTTVEGDTSEASKYNALDLPHGYWPIDIESYNTDIAIALYEGNNDAGTFQRRAKLSFWDTTATNFNKIIDVEFPDPIITALKNVNGVLYTFSGQPGALGTRVCRFLGGYSFEQVAYIDDSEPPFPGAVDAILNRVLFGGLVSAVNGGTKLAGVYGLNSKTGKFNGIFNVMGATNSAATADITSLAVVDQDGFNFQIPVIGWTTGSAFGIDRQTSTYDKVNPIFRSQTFRIGAPFKITKIRFPLAQAVAANMTVIPKIFVDEEATSYTLATINNSNYTGSEKNIVQRPENAVGNHSFFLELKWSGSVLCTMALPITIEYELLAD